VFLAFTAAAFVLMTNIAGAEGVLDQDQWTYNGSHVIAIDPPNGYITFDQSVTAGMTGLLTAVDFDADVTSDRVYFFVNYPGRNEGSHLDATFVTRLSQGSGMHRVDVSAAKIFLRAGDVFSIGLIGAEGSTPAGYFKAAKDANPNAYPGGNLYYRYGGTGWLGLGYDDDMMFRTYMTKVDQEQWTQNGSHVIAIDPPNGHITFDQSVTAGMTGLLTNVEFEADVTSDRVYFFVNQYGRNNGPHLEATYVTRLARGSGVYNVDVSSSMIFLKAGDVFSIGLVGAEGSTPAGYFKAAKDANPNAYPGGNLYYRYGGTGWLGLGYDDDMMFRTYVSPVQLNCFPQMAVGGGYITNFMLLNNGAGFTTGTLSFTDQVGGSFPVKLTAPGYGGSAPALWLSMSSGSTLILKTEALSTLAATKAGWACVESYGGSFGGVATYEYTEAGGLKATVGVLSSQLVEAATVPVDNDTDQGRSTAFAVANYGSEDINIKIVVLDENGNITNTIRPQELNPLGPRSQAARYLHQYDSTKGNFRGSMVFVADGGKRFLVMALGENRGLFTAIPVIPGRAPIVPD